MKEFFKTGMEIFLEKIEALLNGVIEWLLGNLLAPNVIENANTGIEIYNGIIGNAIEMLTTNPMAWNTEAWNFNDLSES